MSAEGQAPSNASGPVGLLQWGRALVSAEGKVVLDLVGSAAVLQWGRALVSAEGWRLVLCLPRSYRASMGPRSGERGRANGCDALAAAMVCFNGAARW